MPTNPTPQPDADVAVLRESLKFFSHCDTCNGEKRIQFECVTCLGGDDRPCSCAQKPWEICPQCEGVGYCHKEETDKARAALDRIERRVAQLQAALTAKESPMPETNVELTPEQLHVLQHSLGLDKYGQGEAYRNHFCAGGKDEEICRGLVDMGLMYVFRANEPPFPYYNCAVTEAGKHAVREQSPKPPKLTRGQRRYREYRKVADCFESFGDYLKYKAREGKHA